MINPSRWLGYLIIGVMLIMSLGILASCSSADSEEGETEEVNSEESDSAAEDEALDDELIKLESAEEELYDGAVIHITAPANGETFSSDTEIVIEVEVLGFDLTAEGHQWTLYIDGRSHSRVADGTTQYSVQRLEPGEHRLEAFLVGKDNLELEDGDEITIVVE
jgi:hypothetical protein